MGILNVQCMDIFSWGNSDENRKHLRFQGLRQSHICRAKVIKTKTHLLRIPLIRLKRPTNSKGHHLYDTNLGQATRTSHFSLLQRISAKSAQPLTSATARSPSFRSEPCRKSCRNQLVISQWEISRILKWRYVSTIFLAIFCGDIPIESGKCLNFPALHRSNVAPVVSQPSAFRGPNCQKADELVSDRPCWGAVGVID